MDESIRKLDKLDNAFLFVISLVGLFFTIIQVYMEGIMGLVEISPLLFLGVVLPFYIGYVRGAIGVDSVVERIRGWVYLVVGISTYLAIFLALINPNLYWLFIVLAFFLIYSLERWSNSIFGIEDNISNLYAFYGTAISGFGWAFISRNMINVYSDLLSNPTYSTSLLSTIWFIYAVLLITVIMEKLSRSVIKCQLPLSQEEIASRRRLCSSVKQLPSTILIFGLELSSIAFEVDLRIRFLLFQALWFGLLGLLLYGMPIFTDIFLIASMLFATVGLCLFLRLKEIDFSKIKLHLVMFVNH